MTLNQNERELLKRLVERLVANATKMEALNSYQPIRKENHHNLHQKRKEIVAKLKGKFGIEPMV